MQSGSLSEQPVYELLCSFAAQRASGRLDLTDGRRKRVFFLEGGKLSGASSNIKSESTAHLKESFPKASEKQLLELQGNLRVINAVSLRDGEWQFSPNEVPENRHPIQLIAACWQGIQRKMSQEEIEARLAGLDGRFPTLNWGNPITLKDLPLDQEMKLFLHELDGERSLEDVVEFAPGEPGLATRAIYLCVITGAVKLDAGSMGAEIRVTRRIQEEDTDNLVSEAISSRPKQAVVPPEPTKETPETKKSSDDMLGIASLIADEIGTDLAAPKMEGTDMTLSTDPEIRALQEVLAKMETAPDFFHVIGVDWDAPVQDYRSAYFALARVYHPDSAVDLPEEQAELVHSIFTHISEAWETLGDEEAKSAYIKKVIHGELDENELATEKVKQILRAEDDFRDAVAHLTAGRIVQAHERLKEVVEIVPDEPEFRAYLGYTTFKLNKGRDDDEAARGEEALRIAVENVANAPGAWVLMGKVYNENGHPDLARRCFVKALKIQPTNPEANLEMKRLKESKSKEKGGSGFLKGLFGKKK